MIDTISLDNLCDSITDCPHSTPKWTESGYIVIRNYNIKNGRLDLSDISFTDEDTFYQRNRRNKPLEGDLIITREAPMGEVCIVPKNLECCMGQRMVLIKLDTKRCDNKYLLYVLLSDYLQKHIKKSEGTGSIVSNLNISDLKKLPIPILEIEEQRLIGKFLSLTDDKIELNNRINSELEAMAKMLYDYWFVQFDFPDKNGKPYKTGGGEMVWSEELKREIPEEWEVESIEKCCIIIDCLHSKKSNQKYEGNYYYLLQLENIEENGLLNLTNKYFVTKTEYKKWTSRIEVVEDDIIITNAGRIAATAQIPKGVKAGIGRNITAIRPLSIASTYLFLSFQGLDMQRQIKWNTDCGAFFSSLNVKGIKKLFIARSSRSIENKFEEIVRPIRHKRELNEKENQQLSELRDWLLPMLMNGQVKVG